MDVSRISARARWLPGGPAVLATWLCVLPSLVPVSVAAQPAVGPDESPCGSLTGVHRRAERSNAATVVSDVIIEPNGMLRGRVIDASGGSAPRGIAGLRARLLRGRQTVAVTTSRAQGEFAVRNLSGGLYLVEVDGAGATTRRLYRVWTSSSAPPRASGEMSVPIAAVVVRGQFLSPFPIMSLQQAAIVTGVAAGAVATPVIYHNARLDNRLPSSP